MGWFKSKEEKPVIHTSKFEHAWLCKCGYITAEEDYCKHPAERFCVKCGAITLNGTSLIGKWTFTLKDQDCWLATRVLISFDVHHIQNGTTWQEYRLLYERDKT